MEGIAPEVTWNVGEGTSRPQMRLLFAVFNLLLLVILCHLFYEFWATDAPPPEGSQSVGGSIPSPGGREGGHEEVGVGTEGLRCGTHRCRPP